MIGRSNPPSTYPAALTLIVLGSVAFYSWLYYMLFEYSLPRVALFSTVLLLATAVPSFLGYRRWAARKYAGTTPNLVSSSRLIGLFTCLLLASVFAWTSIYLFAQSLRLAALLVAVCATGCAYGTTKLMARIELPGQQQQETSVYIPKLLKITTIFKALSILITGLLAGIAFSEGDTLVAVVLVGITLLLTPWAIRHVKRDLKSS